MQSALADGTRRLKNQNVPFSTSGCLSSAGAIAIGVDSFGDSAIEDIIRIRGSGQNDPTGTEPLDERRAGCCEAGTRRSQ